MAIHAIVGGLLSEATGGDFKTGAIAAGANEALVVQLDALVKGDPNLLTMSSQLVGLVAAAAVDGDIEKGAWVAQNATQYNFLGHQELDDLENESRECSARGNCELVKQRFRELSVANDDAMSSMCSSNPALCTQYYGDLLHDRNSLQERLAGMYFDDSIPSLFKDDLHRYQMQNSSAIGVLTQAGSRLELESKGGSPEKAGWGADLLAAMGGFLGGKGKGGGQTHATTGKLPGGQTVAQFEKSLSTLPPGERVAKVKQVASGVAAEYGMIKDNELSRINGRDVYKSADGRIYAVDTQHGRFEMLSSRGKHLGEVDMGLTPISNSVDASGRHDLKVR
ncbi:colicin E3/pyocin S6 family cytotoxin [Pseudomonas resinovorans]|uniref:colicin E3/pyocin S6 family cytotoxin n=1 Tax=Metapseudomonas resinovorans TaxID=53412 RepID=UPI00237F4C7E|nr:colicin E3/pyocin S6 family cytotoxin [Pseudomonas resinovorans]MDE3739082.1 colicin E3/pyocin S6 family cytotoxin [Pseudomonas resinovorans]